MGITGLLPFIENASRKCYINEFRGYTVAIDSYCWLHKGAFACAEKLVRGEKTNIHIMYCLKYLQLLLSYNIKPIMVFDGQHLPAKKHTESKRREQRKAARTRATELLRLGKTDEARQNFRKCVDITHDMALELMKECRKRDIDCIVAPYEADAQLAYLNTQGIAQIVITEDSDLVLFGCSKILFKFSLDGSATLVERDKLYLAMKMRPDEYTFDKFRYMCIMSGCDYLDSLPGIGLKKAHKAVVMTHDPNIYNLLPRLPRYLNIQKLKVSKEYIENFKLADATIRHQIVYDPIKRGLVRLTDLESTGFEPEYLKNAGEMYDNDKALQMALGNIDPFSLEVKDDWNPDAANLSTKNINSIWFKQYKKPKSPQKTPKRPSISAKAVTISTENILAMQQQEMLNYDNNLTEELKVYQTTEPPSKRLKLNEESVEESHNSEIKETELNEVKICNPFIKKKQPKRLSKFESTNLENNQCVRSPFFPSTSKDLANSVTESEGNTNTPSEVEKENNSEIINASEILSDLYSQSTISSNEYCNSDDQGDETNNCINLKTFACNKLKKLSKSINKRPNIDSGNLSNTEESQSKSLYSDRLSVSSANEDTSLCCVEQQYQTGEKINTSECNSEDENLLTSPVLAVNRFACSKQYSNVGMFKFNSSKKKMCKRVLVIDELNVEHSTPACDNEKNKESDIENLTPEESFKETAEESSIVNENCKETSVVSNHNMNSVINTHKDDIISDICKDEPEDTIVHNKMESTKLVKKTFKRSDSCRSVGLSRNRKRTANQPTILSMFNKMTTKD